MNAVEISDAVSALVEQPFDRDNFPFAFLEAFGNKETTLKKLRSGDSNKSDLGGVLQRSNIHLKVCAPGEVAQTLKALRESPATARLKAKFILATDGETIEAENLADDDEPIVCAYADFSDHFGYFLPLAGITTVKQIRESSFDIKATGRLNRFYIELLKDNPEWATAARREDLNHFMARLIFCFFAEDTDIFHGEGLFSDTVEQMSAGDPSKTGEVISELFRAMNIPIRHEGKISNFHRDAAGIRNWANVFPYVNGGLFTGSAAAAHGEGKPYEVPHFSRIARAYLLKVGELPWQKINPDIFGSMIQAVADDEERGALGMHYTSVPNILKVLNPLFLDELREKLAEAGNNPRKLLNLRQRIARLRGLQGKGSLDLCVELADGQVRLGHHCCTPPAPRGERREATCAARRGRARTVGTSALRSTGRQSWPRARRTSLPRRRCCAAAYRPARRQKVTPWRRGSARR